MLNVLRCDPISFISGAEAILNVIEKSAYLRNTNALGMTPGIYTTKVSLNLYELDEKKDLEAQTLELGTQVASGRYLKVRTGPPIKIRNHELIKVQLCEDEYEGFVKSGEYLKEVLEREPYRQKRIFRRPEIEKLIPDVLAFVFEAMQTPDRWIPNMPKILTLRLIS